MSENFIEAYKDSISRSIEYFAYEMFTDNNLDFLLDESEEFINYVDGLYMKDVEQILYFFSHKKIRKTVLFIEEGKKTICSSTMNASNIQSISLKHAQNDNTVLTIKFINGEEIVLDNNNVFEYWKQKSTKRIKDIYKMYY